MNQKYLSGSLVFLLSIGSLLPSSFGGGVDDQVTTGIAQLFVTDWWSMFRHDLSHSGYSSSSAPTTNATLWTFGAGSSVHSSPAIVNGKVYFGSMDCNVYCLNAITGVKIWQRSTGHPISSSPAVYENRVYIGSTDTYGENGNNLYCLNATTGESIWEYGTGDSYWGMYSSPAVVDEKVFAGSGDHKIYCFNAMTGQKLWGFGTNDEVASSPAVVNGKVYIGTEAGTLYCLNASTGAQLWVSPLTDQIQSSPTVANGKVYVGLDKMYCIDAETGDPIWEMPPDFLYSSPAYYNDKIYACDTVNGVHCLNATYGWPIWEYEVGPGDLGMWSSPAVADGKIYVGACDGKVYCLDANTGEKIWEYFTNYYPFFSSPTIANCRVYIGDMEGNVYCFGQADNPPDKPNIYGPGNGITGVEYTFCTDTITDPEGDSLFCLWDWRDGNTTGWLGPYMSGETIYASHTWTEPGVYCIRLNLKDPSGLESGWSEPFCVTIVENHPPNKPWIDGPTWKRPGTYNYTFNATDPDGDSLSFFIDWGDGTYEGWYGLYPPGEVVVRSHTFSKIGTYTIKAKAKDIYDAEGDWGAIPIRIPADLMIPPFFLRLLERFPQAFPLLRHLLKL